jgi:hypothetical protein
MAGGWLRWTGTGYTTHNTQLTMTTFVVFDEVLN